MGLQSQLLGAYAEGIRNVLAVTGDPPHVGDYPGSNGVYDIDSIGLTALLSHLNRGEDYSGKAIDAPTSFFVGVAVNPSADDLDGELERFRQKIDAGARFAMTQALFDIAYLDRFLERLGGESPIPLLVGVWPVRSYQLAYRLHNEVPGITIPDEVRAAMQAAGERGAEVGLEQSLALLEAVGDAVAGTYIMPSFGRYEQCAELVRRVRVRHPMAA
jgi:homocysteine S-methyltransferase